MLHLPVGDELASDRAIWPSTFHWLNCSVDTERAEQYHVMLVEGVALLACLMDKFD